MLRSLPKGLKAGGRLFVSTPYLPCYLVPSRRALTTVGLSLEERKLELEARKLDTEERRWKEELEERRQAKKEEERRWNEEKSREERRWNEEERRWNRQKFKETIIEKGWVVFIGVLFYGLGPSVVSKLYGSCLAKVPNIQQTKTKIEEEMVEARMNDAGQRAIDCPPFEEKISNSQPKQIKELLNSDSHRVIILDGPRGSGKSWSLGKALQEIKAKELDLINWAKDNKAKVVMASSNTHVSRIFATAVDKIHYVGDLENKDIMEHLPTHELNQKGDRQDRQEGCRRFLIGSSRFRQCSHHQYHLGESIDETVKSLSESAQPEYDKVRNNLALQDIVPVLSKITRYAGEEEKNGSSPPIPKFLPKEEKAFQELMRTQILMRDSNGRVVFASKFLQECFLKNLLEKK